MSRPQLNRNLSSDNTEPDNGGQSHTERQPLIRHHQTHGNNHCNSSQPQDRHPSSITSSTYRHTGGQTKQVLTCMSPEQTVPVTQTPLQPGECSRNEVHPNGVIWGMVWEGFVLVKKQSSTPHPAVWDFVFYGGCVSTPIVQGKHWVSCEVGRVSSGLLEEARLGTELVANMLLTAAQA